MFLAPVQSDSQTSEWYSYFEYDVPITLGVWKSAKNIQKLLKLVLDKFALTDEGSRASGGIELYWLVQRFINNYTIHAGYGFECAGLKTQS